MQISAKWFLGMDVSKAWVDLTMLPVVNHQKQPLLTYRFDNTPAGIKKLDGWLKKHKVPFTNDSLLVIENTGIYHRLLWQYCSLKGLPLYIGNAAHLKWSFGLSRGKSDTVDSKRLCAYAFRHHDELKAAAPLDPVILQLKDLMTTRSLLLSQKNALQNQLGERKNFQTREAYEQVAHALLPLIEALKQSLQNIEAQIKKTVNASASIRTNYELLITVPGIGHLTAVYLICCTANFSGGRSGRQLACYAGVVPFGHSSGSSIKGKDKVHPMANKNLKKLLHLGAVSAIKNHSEFKDYYHKKKEEGKHAMSILNAIRNKLVLRACAVIKHQQPYKDTYQKTA
jgi:transposase